MSLSNLRLPIKFAAFEFDRPNRNLLVVEINPFFFFLFIT